VETSNNTSIPNKVLKGAGILAVCALVAKVIGVLYRIPLTNIVGSEGIGLYQMIFPLYVVLLTISSGGLPVAISRVVASRIAKGDSRGAKKVLVVALISLSIIGAILGTLLFVFRNQIATLQGNPNAALGYAGIAPSILFVAIIACFRGYYQGKQNMLPSALSQIIEQVIKLSAGLFLAYLLMPRGVEYAIFGALIGVSISEIFAAVVLFLQFLVTSKRQKTKSLIKANQQAAVTKSEISQENFLTAKSIFLSKEKNTSVLKEICLIAIPVTLGSLVLPLTQLIDSVLVINFLTRNGMETVQATGLFGILTGPVGTLINMPAVITLSFAIALLPKISQCFINKECIAKFVGQGIKFNFILGLLATLFFSFYSRPILSLLYGSGLTQEEISLASKLLILGSVSVVYVSILQVATSVLQGVGKAHRPAINLLFGAVLKVGLTILLLPQFGIFGAMIATAACFSLVCLLDIIAIKKYIKISLPIKEILIAPLIAGVAFSLVAVGLSLILRPFLTTMIITLITLPLATIIFIVLIIALKSIKKEELKSMLPKRLFRRKQQQK